jgi:hypothetical protein
MLDIDPYLAVPIPPKTEFHDRPLSPEMEDWPDHVHVPFSTAVRGKSSRQTPDGGMDENVGRTCRNGAENN